MKIAHVVTYLSADHAFGGPLSVARAQTSELARRGHEVDLLSGWDGIVHADLPGVRIRTFRVRRAVPRAGFSGLIAPGLSRQLMQPGAYDVVHLHLARDLVTLPSARRLMARHVPYVLQPHGMVMPDRRLRARVLDSLATRSVLRHAARVLALTDVEAAGLGQVARASLPVASLPNGVPSRPAAHRGGERTTDEPDVLFLARLHPRKKVLSFAAMAALLVQRGVRARFSVAGPDEGELSALQDYVRRHGLEPHLAYEGPLAAERVPERLARASVFVLPSVNEPFPMTVLEALAAGTAAVVTDTCHIAPLLRSYCAASVTDGSPAALADAVHQILNDADVAHRLRKGARRALTEEFNITAVVDRLESIYAESINAESIARGSA